MIPASWLTGSSISSVLGQRADSKPGLRNLHDHQIIELALILVFTRQARSGPKLSFLASLFSGSQFPPSPGWPGIWKMMAEKVPMLWYIKIINVYKRKILNVLQLSLERK